MSSAPAAIVKSPPARFSRWTSYRDAGASFVAVLACYWLYWLIAVPIIEPSLDERPVVHSTPQEQIEDARATVTVRQRELVGYFSPGEWETDAPKIWQSDQMRLLFQELKILPDGSVQLKPCTLMFFPKKKDPAAPERPIIMQARQGLNVKFDEKIVVKTFDLNNRRFQGGQLLGPITIRQKASAPGAADDLEITTSNVMMDSQRAWTSEPVNFRMGRSVGRGRELEILLAATDGAAEANVMRGATVRSLMLKRDVRMRLEMGSNPLVNASTPARPKEAQPPVEISCKGVFEFNMEDYAASFHDQVDVFRLNPTGQSDQLNCEVLTVYFETRRPPAAEGATQPGAPPPADRPPVRLIQARGNPVKINSPAQGLEARCHGIVDMIPGSGGNPGSVIAAGEGTLQGNLPKDPAGKYSAQWSRELRFEPDGALQRATLRGTTVARFGQMGTITADEVFAWMSAKPVAQQAPAPKASPAGSAAAAWQLERLLAQQYGKVEAPSNGKVVVDAPQMLVTASAIEARVNRLPPSAIAAAPGAAPPPEPKKQAKPEQNPENRFSVHGGTVLIQLVPQGEQLSVSSVTIDQQARLEQLVNPAAPPRQPLLVTGDRLHVADASSDGMRVSIAGRPGRIEADGMTLVGNTIEMERKTNWLWIVGPGRLTMPMSQDLDGKPLARATSLAVGWQKRMDFQSNRAVFDGDVVARSEQQVVNTQKLEATLSRAIDFSNPVAANRGRPQEQPQLATLRTYGRTHLEGRQLDERGEQSAFYQMELSDLAVDRTTGAVTGAGPGWIKQVSKGSSTNMLGGPSAAKPVSATTAKDQLSYLFVTFQKSLDGDINRRMVKLSDRTKTLYGPVPDWNAKLDAKDRAGLGPQGIVLESRELEVREMSRRSEAKRGWFELDASGNVLAEGQKFTAQGDKLTYAEEKDQLVLKGEPAEMFVENPNGGPRQETRAKEVRYWFARHYVQVTGAQLLNLGVPNQPRRETSEAPGAAAPR